MTQFCLFVLGTLIARVFAVPSQSPIGTYLPTSDQKPQTHGTIDISSYGLHQPIPVTFSISSQVCMPLIHEVPYMVADLSQRMLSEYLDKISFPLYDPHTPTLPIYLAAHITELIYRSKFVLSLSLKLSPVESGLKGLGTREWRVIMGLLEQSALELDRDARKRRRAGLGSVVVTEAKMGEVHVLAEWRFWKMVDGVAVICES